MLVIIAGQDLDLNSETGRALIEDLARYVEGLLENEDLVGTWGTSASELTAIKNDPEVLELVRAVKHRREQDGSAARERARKAFAKAPHVLAQILDDTNAPTRAKIEASRELRAAAGFSANHLADPPESFHVTINLGAGQVKQFRLTGQGHRDEDGTVDATCTQPRLIGPLRDREDGS
jgi:hypothetical protein